MGTHGTQNTNPSKILYTDSLEPRDSANKLPITADYNQFGENKSSMVNLLGGSNSKYADIHSRNLNYNQALEGGQQLIILKTEGETSQSQPRQDTEMAVDNMVTDNSPDARENNNQNIIFQNTITNTPLESKVNKMLLERNLRYNI